MRPLCILVTLFITALARGQAPTAAYSIKGFLPYWKGASITLSVDGTPVHALTLDQDVYSYTGQASRPTTGLLEINTEGKPHFLPFFIEPGVIRIRDKGGRQLEVYGTPINDAFLALTHRFDSLVLEGRSGPAGEGLVTKKNLAKSYIRSHPHSLISLQLLHDYFYLYNAKDDTAYAALFNVLDPELKQTSLGRKIEKEVTFSSQSALGVQAPGMELPDSAGVLRPVYRTGEYTLVNFWASWCIPCNKELPELLAVHRRYSARGFSITGVSLDRNPLAWKVAAARWPWKQLIDVGSFAGAAARNYGIRVVPTSLLLDRNGVIIAKDLSLPDLEKKLDELLGTF